MTDPMAESEATKTPLEQVVEVGAASAPSRGTTSGETDIEAEPLSLERVIEILQDKLSGWFDGAIALLPNLLIALVVILLGFAVGSLAGRIANKFFHKTVKSVAVANLLAAIIQVLVVAIGFFFALDLIGLQKAVISLLAGAGILGLAIGFAFQDLAENLLAGLLLGIRKPFEPGDLIKSNNQFGFVRTLNLRNTIIRNFSGQVIYIPNKEVFKSVLENFSKTGERRIEIAVGVSYGEDLKHVADVLKNAVEALPGLKEDKPVEVFALEFGDSSINFSVRYWIDYPPDKIGYFDAIDAGIKAIKTAFDQEDILIPFPIRTLDFDAKGGVKLPDAISPALAKSNSKES